MKATYSMMPLSFAAQSKCTLLEPGRSILMPFASMLEATSPTPPKMPSNMNPLADTLAVLIQTATGWPNLSVVRQ